jgi:hypothetical protein
MSNLIIELIFLVTWLVGAVLTALTFWLSRTLPRRRSATIRALVLAVFFTPSIVVAFFYGGGVSPAPAILVLAMAPSWTYALLLGALPIALVWAALRLWLLRQPN